MGFFSKIKQNLTHGGVKVRLHAPASVSMQDAILPVTVDITSTDAPQTVSGVRVEIIAESRNQSFNPSANATTTSQSTQRVVARSENNQGFTLTPGATQTIQFEVVMNAGKAAAEQVPENSGLAQVAHAMQNLQSLTEAMSDASNTYSIRAVANVEGIALDPADTQPLQILKPGQFGGAMNIRL